jgi:hypothetical protein
MVSDGTFLILGGGGLVGYQVAHRIAEDLQPERIVIASLTEPEVDRAVDGLRQLTAGVEFVGEWGDVFVRDEFAGTRRADLLEDDASRDALFDDLLGPFDAAYERSRLARIIAKYRPDVVVDAVNTATAISYQDAHTSAILAERDVAALISGREVPPPVIAHDVETLILSLSVPQLIRHVLVLERALREAGSRMYLKVGTTGTGGMGLNIPYTHSEDKPSAKLMTKTAVAFAHTGLLFLMARTSGGPLVKEIKPGALIGYADVAARVVRESGAPIAVHRARSEELGDLLTLRLDAAGFDRSGDLVLPVVDTGENGLFTKGEFEAVTAPGQMELVTPEEIAHLCVEEIRGAQTGRDVIAGIDSTVLNPSYRGGYLRGRALQDLERLEAESGSHSVALGQLGPPELSKILWEAELLTLRFKTIPAVIAAGAEEISKSLITLLEERPDLADTIVSIGMPILLADGVTLLRGPMIRIPEVPGDDEADVTEESRDAWAAKGWVDLRPDNMERWRTRLAAIHDSRPGTAQPGSAGITPDSTITERIVPGAIAAWVLRHELDGWRIK